METINTKHIDDEGIIWNHKDENRMTGVLTRDFPITKLITLFSKSIEKLTGSSFDLSEPRDKKSILEIGTTIRMNIGRTLGELLISKDGKYVDETISADNLSLGLNDKDLDS